MNGFDSVVGHDQIIEYIRSAVRQEKVSHAYILSGERGSGKKLLAKLFAMTLECERGGDEPCMECRSCKKAADDSHPDIIHLVPEKPTRIGVDDIREQINDDIIIKPYSGPYKIYIIDGADKMTAQAQNALLKTIEEPPAYAVIFLLAENADALLPTIRSRCVMLKLKNIKDSLIKRYLMEVLKVPDYQADTCAAFAQGNMGKAIALASSEHFGEIRGDVVHLLRNVRGMDVYELIAAVKDMGKYKLEVNDCFDLMMIWFRDVLMYKATRDPNAIVFSDQLKYIERQAQSGSYEGIEEIIGALDRAKARLKANVNFELTMELLLLTIKENL